MQWIIRRIYNPLLDERKRLGATSEEEPRDSERNKYQINGRILKWRATIIYAKKGREK